MCSKMNSHCAEWCEWYHVVPCWVAMKVYVFKSPGAIGHSVIPLVPSMMLALGSDIPCQ